MNCAEFQKVLPYIIETGGNAEEEGHLRRCRVCTDLVQDLKYIAEQAKLLLPMQEPNAQVWIGIQNALEREGLIRPAAGTARFRAPAAALTLPRWGTVGGLMAFAALLLLAFGLLAYRSIDGGRPAQPVAAVTPRAAVPAAADEDDAQLLSSVQQHAPAMLATYQENLSSVNAYIRDAQRTVDADPDDAEARDHLMRAYDEKALLYEMALSRSLQ